MPTDLSPHVADLPPHVQRALQVLVAEAEAGLGSALISIVLFGSAAEGRLRSTSDVNLILVLAGFERARVDALREPLRLAHAAAKVETMWLLVSELAAASEAFAVKFADVLRRRRVLFGRDVFAGLAVTRAAEIAGLRQVTLNLALRGRDQYLRRSLRAEQATALLADLAGPLRSSAAALLELEGVPVESGRSALEQVCRSLGDVFATLPVRLSELREGGRLGPEDAAIALFDAVRLAGALHDRAVRLT